VPRVSPDIRKVFTNPLVLNQEYREENFHDDLASGLADAISFGRPYISNPDLVNRIAKGLPWADNVMATWYSAGPVGYTDYPVAA
jgi:N-ethylmaleimide reductase